MVRKNPDNDKEILMKLTDFGLSQTFTPGGSVMTDATAGTNDYKASEVLISNLFDAFKTDIYSLGVSLCESLVCCDTRRPPVMLRIVETIQKGVHFTAISQSVQQLLRGMTIKEPENRFGIDQVLEHPWT